MSIYIYIKLYDVTHKILISVKAAVLCILDGLARLWNYIRLLYFLVVRVCVFPTSLHAQILNIYLNRLRNVHCWEILIPLSSFLIAWWKDKSSYLNMSPYPCSYRVHYTYPTFWSTNVLQINNYIIQHKWINLTTTLIPSS